MPSDSEANEGRDMLSKKEGKDSETREDLTSSVNSVDSFPEGESKRTMSLSPKGKPRTLARKSPPKKKGSRG